MMLKCPICGSNIDDNGDEVELYGSILVHKRCVNWYKVDTSKCISYEDAKNMQKSDKVAFIPVPLTEMDIDCYNI